LGAKRVNLKQGEGIKFGHLQAEAASGGGGEISPRKGGKKENKRFHKTSGILLHSVGERRGAEMGKIP